MTAMWAEQGDALAHGAMRKSYLVQRWISPAKSAGIAR